MQPSSPSLEDLGALVQQRRESALRLGRRKAAEAGDIAAMTWNRVENGLPVQTMTYAGVEKALRWPQGSIKRYLDTGVTPEPVPETPELEGDHGPPIGLASYDRILDELRRRHEADRAELARALHREIAPGRPLSAQRRHLAESGEGETAESVEARGGSPGLPLDDRSEDDSDARGGPA